MDYYRSELKHGDKFRVEIVNGSKYKLSGFPVDKHGDKYDNAPEIRLWAGPDTALKKSNFGKYAEVALMNAGFKRGILRGYIKRSGSLEEFKDSVYHDSIRKLSFIVNDYDSPLSELSDEELSIDPPTTKEGQHSEGIDSKHTKGGEEWDARKSDTMNDLPDL